METYPNAVHWLQELLLLRLRIYALREREQRLRSALERTTPGYGAAIVGYGASMEDRMVALVETQEKTRRATRDWAARARKAEGLLAAIKDETAREVLKLLYLRGQKESAVRKALGLSEELFSLKLRRGLKRAEELLSESQDGGAPQ